MKLRTIMEAYLASAQVPEEPPVRAQKPVAPIVPMDKWVLEDKERLRKLYRFNEFDNTARDEFVRRLLDLERQHNKDAEVYILKHHVTIRIWLSSELDKEFAKAVDCLFKDVMCPLVTVYLHNTVG